jgi:hypothetical protein
MTGSLSVGPVRKFASILLEKSDYAQENYRPDNCVDNLCDDSADENKAGQWQKPTCQDGANNADDDITKNSKTVALDEVGCVSISAIGRLPDGLAHCSEAILFIITDNAPIQFIATFCAWSSRWG